jgi:hypothetical protein
MKMASKNKEVTPRSQVRQALRLLWMRSRERAEALKRDNNTCQMPGCGKKKSVAKGREVKVECHHNENIGNWDVVIDSIYRHILCHHDHLTTLCKECHAEVHKTGEL